MTSSSILNTFAAATNNRSRLKKDHNHIYNGNNSTATNLVVDETDNRPPMEATSTITSSNNNTGQENGSSISSAASSPKSSFINDYCNGGSGESATKPPPSSSIRVRLLVFLEDCDGTRSVIFDSAKFSSNHNRSSRHNHDNNSSNSVGKMSTGTKTTSSGADISNNFNKSSLSSTHLSNEMMIRMVFGSFPMKVSNNVAIKVHALKYILIVLT